MIRVLALFVVLVISTAQGKEQYPAKGSTPAKALAPSLKLEQAQGALPVLTAYIEVRGTTGRTMQALSPENLSATIGDKKAAIKELIPFARSSGGVGYVFLVDISRSVARRSWGQIQRALRDWIATLGNGDRLALLTFGDTVNVVSDFTGDKTVLSDSVGRLKPTDNQTSLHQGLIEAVHLAQRLGGDVPQRRIVIVLSDGIDDVVGGATQGEVQQTLEVNRVPIYAVGIKKPPSKGKPDEGIKALGLFARTSGGAYLGPGSGRAEGDVYGALRDAIESVLVAKIACPDCTANGSIQRLELTLSLGGLVVADGLNMRLLPQSPDVRRQTPSDVKQSGERQTAPSPTATPKIVANGKRGGEGQATPAPQPTPKPVNPDSGFEALKQHGLLYLAGGGGLAVLIVAMVIARRKVQQGKDGDRPPKPPESESNRPPPDAGSVPPVSSATSPASTGSPNDLALTVLTGFQRGKKFDVPAGEEITLGRLPSCQVFIEGDSEISSRHCVLYAKAGAVFVRDLSSTNGTLVNGVPISTEYKLRDGDVLGVGRSELRVSFLGGQK